MAFALFLSGIILVIPVFIMTYILFQDPVPVIILFDTVYPIMVLISLLVITKTDNGYHLILKYSTGARQVFDEIFMDSSVINIVNYPYKWL